MARQSLKGLLKTIGSVTNTLPIEKQFITDLTYSIEKEDSKNKRVPSKTFKPSSIGGCKRNIYFQLTGAAQSAERSSCGLIGICESGTDRHIRLQEAICKMKENGIDCEYIDVADYVKNHNLTDVEIVSKSGIETKCYNKVYNISFLTDGIIRYKNRYYILEIKTEISNKFWNHSDVRPEHKAQGVTYFLSFGIPDILYLYENRDTLEKKAFMFHATDEMVEEIKDTMGYVNRCVEEDTIPPKEEEKNKCQYCNYSELCESLGD